MWMLYSKAKTKEHFKRLVYNTTLEMRDSDPTYIKQWSIKQNKIYAH